MGSPNAWRSAAYLAATSSDACAMPSACAATPILPPSSVFMAILKPSPRSPRRLDFGISQSSKMRLQVELARMPNLSSGAPSEKPGVFLASTKKAEMPLCLSALSVVQKTTAASASRPFVIQLLVPLSTKPPSVSVANADAAPASLPFDASVSPKQPIFSPVKKPLKNVSACSSVQLASTGAKYSELCADTTTPVLAQPLDISSIASA
mmetsp:Transcript_19478/g.60138  ORF Transcript_19478/g.60138 Transcript_19478/m.60138 type:complete len:208 (+) Transcript_19478:414-1037(+)